MNQNNMENRYIPLLCTHCQMGIKHFHANGEVIPSGEKKKVYVVKDVNNKIYYMNS